MVKNKEEVVEQTEQLIEQQTPLEKQIADRPKLEKPIIQKATVTPTKVDFGFSNDTLANEEEMSQVRDILTSGEQQSEDLIQQDLFFLSVEEVAHFLEATYQIQGVFTYPDLWKRPKEFFYEIAEGILPNLNNWAARIPAVGHAIKTVSAAGSWGRLIWDMAFTWIRVNKQRELEKKAKLEEDERNGGTYNDYSNQSIKPGGIIVP